MRPNHLLLFFVFWTFLGCSGRDGNLSSDYDSKACLSGSCNSDPYTAEGARGGTETGNPMVQLLFGPILDPSLKIYFCIDEIKLSNSTTTKSKTIELDDVDVLLSQEFSTLFAEIKIPEGFFDQLSVQLSSKCDSEQSARVESANGSFETDLEISLKFVGNLSSKRELALVKFDVSPLAIQLNGVRSDSELEMALKAYSGKAKGRKKN